MGLNRLWSSENWVITSHSDLCAPSKYPSLGGRKPSVSFWWQCCGQGLLILPEAGGPTAAFQWAPEQSLGTRSFYFPVGIHMREKEGLWVGGLYRGSDLFSLTQWHRLRP